MTASLAERAAQMAGRTDPPDTAAAAGRTYAVDQLDQLAAVDPVELPPAPDDAASVPVHVAWARVMADVQAIRKDSVGDLTGRGRMVNFRGIDATMNAFGAAQRRHGVIVRSVGVVPTYRDAVTSKGNKMRECTVIVTYEITGPRGDSIQAMSVGEALDVGDKATAKAQSTALRTMLLQAGMVPTDAPRDPDQDVYERGEAAVRPAVSYRDEILDEGTSAGRLRQIRYELRTHGQLGDLVADQDGAEVAVAALIDRVGMQRFGGGEQPATAADDGSDR
jgi:ERF superfamily